MNRLIKEHEYPRWQRGEEIGPRLARDRSDEDDWEEDDGNEDQPEIESRAEVRDQESRAAGGDLRDLPSQGGSGSIGEELFGSEFFSDEDSTERWTPAALGPSAASSGGDTVDRSPTEDSVPADEFGFPSVSPLIHRLASDDVTEVFSPPRVTAEAKEFGPKVGEAWDLTTGWDFTRESHRRAASKYVDERKPLVIIGSPPCTPFSQLQSLNPRTAKSCAKRAEGVEHMRFVIGLYRKRVQEGRAFLHEHPNTRSHG